MLHKDQRRLKAGARTGRRPRPRQKGRKLTDSVAYDALRRPIRCVRPISSLEAALQGVHLTAPSAYVPLKGQDRRSSTDPLFFSGDEREPEPDQHCLITFIHQSPAMAETGVPLRTPSVAAAVPQRSAPLRPLPPRTWPAHRGESDQYMSHSCPLKPVHGAVAREKTPMPAQSKIPAGCYGNQGPRGTGGDISPIDALQTHMEPPHGSRSPAFGPTLVVSNWSQALVLIGVTRPRPVHNNARRFTLTNTVTHAIPAFPKHTELQITDTHTDKRTRMERIDA